MDGNDIEFVYHRFYVFFIIGFVKLSSFMIVRQSGSEICSSVVMFFRSSMSMYLMLVSIVSIEICMCFPIPYWY